MVLLVVSVVIATLCIFSDAAWEWADIGLLASVDRRMGELLMEVARYSATREAVPCYMPAFKESSIFFVSILATHQHKIESCVVGNWAFITRKPWQHVLACHHQYFLIVLNVVEVHKLLTQQVPAGHEGALLKMLLVLGQLVLRVYRLTLKIHMTSHELIMVSLGPSEMVLELESAAYGARIDLWVRCRFHKGTLGRLPADRPAGFGHFHERHDLRRIGLEVEGDSTLSIQRRTRLLILGDLVMLLRIAGFIIVHF